MGGAERVAVVLSNAAAERGHRVHLVTAIPGGFWADQLDPRVEWQSLDHPGPFRKGGVPKLWRALRSFSPDIFHGFLNVGNYYGAILARLARVPLVVSNLDSVVDGIGWSALERRAARFCLRYLAHVGIAAGDTVCESVRTRWHIPATRLVSVPNAVDCAVFTAAEPAERAATRQALGLADGQVVLLSVGRLVEEKGFLALVASAAELAPRHPELQWLVVGEGPQRPELEARLATLGLTERVRLLGARRDMPQLVRAADLMVVTSEFEAGPIVLLEALSAGLPAISTRVGVAEQVVVPHETGWLVPPGEVAALVAASEQALAQRECWPAFGAAGRQRVLARFDLAVVANRYFEVYEAWLSHHRATNGH